MPPKRRRRFQGLYYHSSPPKVLPMNGQIANTNGRRRRDPDDLSVKLSTIRIWMHEKDIGKLTRVLWAGQGNRLRQQASTNPKVKRFLTAVPHVMNSIKDVHQAVIDNSLENLQANLEPPVPPALVTCRDANGLNLIHKAAGLGHATILEYLITTWPDGVHETDITGKTPLHWAASAKNNMRCYTLLTQAGCDEEAVDYKMKTPSFYRHKPHEIERAFLTYVPEAPRVSPDIATDWEALSDDSGDGKKLDIKIPEMNGFGRHSNAESNENTSEAEMTEAANGHEDEEMSKDEEETENAEPAVENDQDHEEAADEEAESKDAPEDTEEQSHGENEEEQAKEEDEEPTDAKEDNEDQEKETQDEQNEENNKDEEPQDEKQQTETLNETTANLTKDSEDAVEIESKTEKENNESHESQSNGHIAENENNEDNSPTDDLKTESEMAKVDQESIEKIEHETAIPDEKPTENEIDENHKDTADEKKSETDHDENNKEILDDEIREQEVGEVIKDNLDEKISEPDNDKKSTESLDENINGKDNNENSTESLDENTNGKDNNEKSKEALEELTKLDDDKKANDEEKTDDKNKPDSEIQTGLEINNASEEDVGEVNANEEDKDNGEDKEDSKTIGEALVDIKDEVKDNVKYLATQIKNVFSSNDDAKEEEIQKENEDLKTAESKESNDIKETQNQNDDEKLKKDDTPIEDHSTESKELNEHKETEIQKDDENIKKDDKKVEDQTTGNDQEQKENEQKQNDNSIEESKENTEAANNQENQSDEKIIEKTKESNENVQELPSTSSDAQKTSNEEDSNKSTENSQPLAQIDTGAPTTIDSANANSSNENTKQKTPTTATPTTSPKESPKKENDKTDEDENNNTNKLTTEVETTSTTTNETDDLNKPNTAEQTTDDQFKDLNKSLEEFKKDGENSIENKEKDIGDKLEEMADNLKENVKEMADKVMNVFSTTSTTKDDHEQLENESNAIVVHTESPQKPTSSKKVVKDGESSDETADEDEEPQVEAENEENNDENEAEANSEEKKDTESQDETEAEPERDPEAEPEPEPEPEAHVDEVDNKDGGDNNEENLDNEELDGEGSPTSSLAIEGFVQGDAEDNTVQSQTAAYVHDDEETHIETIIASGDMEQLAQIVLNGDGQKLLNVEATEPEIQAFLKNVPNYMNKIRRVHEAARNGSLLNLQQALDRRKFAVAKDEISPNGATPLHVAVLFGSSDIVRYLSARFPETTTITDNDGRTALHYAAVINDNGHFYNVLLQLGANPKLVDKMGHTPEDYLGKEELKDTLNYGQLLKRFGAEELEQQLLSDQGKIENPSCQENPIFKTEQGKYLADNLADPLIKALTQVAHKRPNDPLEYLTNYLQTYVSTRNTNGRTITQAAIHSGSSQTNSTVLASSKTSTPPPPPTQMDNQTARMNGHVKYANADSIEEDSMQQLEEYDDDDGNDSDAEISKKLEERDEHGQSMLHFACARSHRKGGLIHLIEEAKADITYRDELYRTARDVALQANQLGNAKEIDRYVMSLAIVGDTKPFEHLAISGYDHIIDILDDNETPIIEVVEARGLMELADYLRTIRPLEELREELHQMIRDNNAERVKEIANGPDGKWLIKAKNYYGRTALHIAILKESIEIVEHFVNRCPEALKVGDNLERTALHYAMGTNIIESISRILIQNGAKRTYKDLKGRQPSYYFMNKADILRLQEEEDENR